jgi:hypothetical protein
MSIAALQQVHDEVRRLAIAGSDLAAGDFRLKRLITPLEKSAEKAPVFGKVAEAAKRLVDCTPASSAGALLELSSLVSAILYTQGATGAEGDLEPLETTDLGLTVANTSARVLKPLIEALTTTGSGRLEIIRDAHERGAFRDLRLLKHALAAIDDPFGEIGDYVASEVLPLYGRAILGELRARFDRKGRGGHARRLVLMCQIDPEGSRALVAEALESGSKEVKLAAIRCLDARADAIGFLLEQAKSRAKDVRAAAFRALAPIDQPAAVDLILTTLGGPDCELVAPYVGENPNPQIAAFLVEEIRRELERIADGSEKGPAKAVKKQKGGSGEGERMHALLQGLRGRNDPSAVGALLSCFEHCDELAHVYFYGSHVIGWVAYDLLVSRSPDALEALVGAGPRLPPEIVGYGFLAASLTAPKRAFEDFAPAYLDRPSGKSKAALVVRSRAEAIGEEIASVARFKRTERLPHQHHAKDELSAIYGTATLDPRWLEAAVEARDLELIVELAAPGNAKLEAFVAQAIEVELTRTGSGYNRDLNTLVQCLVQIAHPKTVPLFLSVMERQLKRARHDWETHGILRLIPDLPAAAITPLEALIPKVDDRLLDAYVGHLDELKQRHG